MHEKLPVDPHHPEICEKINECVEALNLVEGKKPPCGKKDICYCSECVENPDAVPPG